MPKQRTTPGKNVSSRRMGNAPAFRSAYGALNAAQKEAVDTVEGPLMVVAGPGTGKTHVVSLRVANILQRTHARPQSILCLTFSRSGATAMRERLRSIIGADAYGVNVNTIHGFANDIIMQHPIVFEDWSSLHQISDVERYRTVNAIIDSLSPGMALVNAKSPYSRTRDILARISQFKREGVTDPVRLQQTADAYEERMASKSREGTKVHKANLRSARKFRDLIEVFLRYQEELQRTGRYDYDDMILNVIGALEQEPWLLSSLQERYQYILVDEYQDTNGAQNRLIEILTTDPTADNAPNLCVVGDDDQAIYRFQGANVQNILSFVQRFPDAPIVVLTRSYRCTQTILDAAGSLIAQNTERLVGRIAGVNKDLVAATQEEGKPPTMFLAASDMAEPWLIADMLEERLEQGIAPGDIAVIVRTNAELLKMHAALASRSIPYQLSGKLDLMEHPLVSQVIAILRAILDLTDDHRLSSALSCACFGCHPADVATLNSAVREQKQSLQHHLLAVDQEHDLALRQIDTIIRARDVLFGLHNALEQRTLMQTLEVLYHATGILAPIQRGEIDVVDFAALQEFFDQVQDRVLENPHFSFRVLLDDLEYFGNQDYRDLRLTYELPHLQQEGVQIMTAHQSKGLEFHTVLIANFREGHWDKRRNPPSVSVPEDLLYGWEKKQKQYEEQQDERRLAYVAMTRAKRELIFTCPRELTAGTSIKDVSPSGFFAQAGTLPEEKRDVRDPGRMSTLLSPPVRHADAEFDAYLRQRLEHFALSPTALNAFLQDPQVFLHEHLLQKPQARNTNFAFGNAVHHALARWAVNLQAGKPMDKETLLSEFREHLVKKEILHTKDRERLLHLGGIVLPRYASQRLQPPYPLVHKIEYAINARIGDVPIKGKIDRIDLHAPESRAATVRDFKTGNPKTEKQCHEYGYVRQMVFYALLMEQGMGMIEPHEFILDFLGDEEHDPLQRAFAVGEADKEELRVLIAAVWAKIISLDFTSL